MMNYTFIGILFLMMFVSSVWAQNSTVPQTQAIMIGTVHFGQVVRFSGDVKFYRHSFEIETRYFDYEGNRCQAVFQNLGDMQILALENIQPRLRFMIADQIVNLKDLSKIKWTKKQEGYHFEGKFLIKAVLRNGTPLYIHIPNSPSAKMLNLGYQGNSCGAPLGALPTPWELSSFEYIDQDQQEYRIQLE